MTNTELASEIIAMGEKDQQMRKNGQAGIAPFDKQVDLQNTTRLKEIVSQFGWPTISQVGEEASYAAWLIVQHADQDIGFQKHCLVLMQQVSSDVLPSNIAYLTDRVAVNTGQDQIYGTQFYQDDTGNLVPRPILDRKSLDDRRNQMGLEPFLVYEHKMKGLFTYPDDYENPKIGRFYKSP